MKLCTCCNILKLETEFNKCSRNKDGLQYKCRDYQNKIYFDNYEYNLSYDRKRTQSEERKLYKQNYDKLYYAENKDKRIEYSKSYYREHGVKDLTKEQKEKRKQWYQENKDKLNKQKTKYRQNNPKVRLNESISAGIYYALKENKAGCHWEDLVDFNFGELVKHLESLFDENINWDNYGEYWEIDHIIPVNTFDLLNGKQFHVYWSLQNLRPLEKIANKKRPKDGLDIPDYVRENILKGVTINGKG